MKRTIDANLPENTALCEFIRACLRNENDRWTASQLLQFAVDQWKISRIVDTFFYLQQVNFNTELDVAEVDARIKELTERTIRMTKG